MYETTVDERGRVHSAGKTLGRTRDAIVRFESRSGKGSDGRLYYGDRFTTVKDRKKEIGKGLLAEMIKQLGLTPDDLDL